jgi:hypothetical protein
MARTIDAASLRATLTEELRDAWRTLKAAHPTSVIGIWCGDQEDEERVEYVRALNPPGVVERFARELEEGNDAFFALS